MSNNELTLKPINDLLSEHFFIPDYQRGYRWKRRQVKELLSDILEFCDKEKVSKNEFYCLQPIVIKKRGEQWELVDGQQRLTTIFLILSYFNSRFSEEFRKEIFTLEYQTRTGSKDYLKSLNENKKAENIDFFHMYESFDEIKTWFKDYVNRINDIESVFLNKVQVIWYEINETIDAVEVFTRLNMGKIPLTNAELVKGLFLRSKNFSKGDVTLQQLKIAQEWDGIEKVLQADEMWFFIQNKVTFSNRIEFILKLMADQCDADADIKNDPFYTFLIFNKSFVDNNGGVLNDWGNVKRYFMTIEEWYKDRYLYHLVGYLINQGTSITDIKTSAETFDTKQDFRVALKDKVFGGLFATNKKISDFKDRNDLSAYVKESLIDWEYGSNKIRDALLLFNIATLLSNTASNMRFQFDSYKKENWDIEHVRSVNSEKPQRTDDKKVWLKNILEYFTGAIDHEKQLFMIEDMKATRVKIICKSMQEVLSSNPFDSNLFDRVYYVLLMYFKEDKDRDTDDSIGNLALLDAHTNRSYKNAVFPIKRSQILMLDKKGTFVPLCTKNLFLKYYSKQIDNMMFWTESDRDSYFNSILNTIVDFFVSEKGGLK
jgi:uncharacterized protein with ParB-like and HNH nuclease domain